MKDELFRSAWKRATEAINTAKRRHFASVAEALFALQGQGGNEDVACHICAYQANTSTFEQFDTLNTKRTARVALPPLR